MRNNKTVYRDGDRCLKVFGERYAETEVLGEAYNQALAAEAGLPVPRVLEVAAAAGRWTIVSQYIRGSTLAQRLLAEPQRRDEWLELLVDAQLTEQKTPCLGLGRLREKLQKKLHMAALPADVRGRLLERLAALPEPAAQPAFCHGDFSPDNLVLAGDGTPYILDWAHAAQGSAPADAARSYLLLRLAGDVPQAEVLAEAYLQCYCRRSGTEPQAVRQWLPIVAAAQTVRANAAGRAALQAFID